jgi:NAD(P)-dependent dehydrogenase (short-subunit alcohol dehydrogenase family)
MGKSVAIQLAQKGANLMIVSRSVEKLEAALLEIKVRPRLSLYFVPVCPNPQLSSKTVITHIIIIYRP